MSERLARLFHDTYERLAPEFGYETRKDTKEFDPASPNGKLMIAVCSILQSDKMKRTVLILGGGDWADASADLVDLPDSVMEPLDVLHGQYREWLKGPQKYLNFSDWLKQFKGATESECEVFDGIE